MKVLVINCGSSTLKFQIVATPIEQAAQRRGLVQGVIERIGDEATTCVC
jgi:acetate kinase